ncbi:hypothetical protein TNCV_4440841 [Trichonephila clavipes]|nr:hypothetical protein TNCV_4440841 [Trichonephila clavipes]
MGGFGMVSWTFHEFERNRSTVTANMERNVSRHHTELVCINARSYRICWRGFKRFNAEVVEVDIGGVAIYHPFGEFRRAKSYGDLYGA